MSSAEETQELSKNKKLYLMELFNKNPNMRNDDVERQVQLKFGSNVNKATIALMRFSVLQGKANEELCELTYEQMLKKVGYTPTPRARKDRKLPLVVAKPAPVPEKKAKPSAPAPQRKVQPKKPGNKVIAAGATAPRQTALPKTLQAEADALWTKMVPFGIQEYSMSAAGDVVKYKPVVVTLPRN